MKYFFLKIEGVYVLVNKYVIWKLLSIIIFFFDIFIIFY